MNAIERRQYEMLLRVQDFGHTHGALLSQSAVAQQAFATIGGLIDQLTVTNTMKMSASVSARADRKAQARRALTDLLVKVSNLAKVLRARGQVIPPLELPPSRSDQQLLTAARQFAGDAAPLEAEFTAHGMPLTLLPSTAGAFETALRNRGVSRADHTAARARIRELLATALVEARRLDLIISNELADDAVIRTVWKQSRRVGEPRALRTAPADEEGTSRAGAVTAAAVRA